MLEGACHVEVALRSRVVAVSPAVIIRLVEQICAGEGQALSLSVVVVDHEESQRANREFLSHDYPTDVIAFDLRGDGEGDGEVIVNAAMAKEVAAAHGNSSLYELLFYVAHGVLHLLGYDDAQSEERTQMHHLQAEYLNQLQQEGLLLP